MLETTPARTVGRPRRPRRRGFVVLVSLVLILIGLVAAAAGFYRYASGSSGPQMDVAFTIPPGATGSEVAALLDEQGVIRSTIAFKLVARIKGIPLEFDAGTYDLSTNMSAGDVLAVLTGGSAPELGTEVLFPEGYRLEQVAARAEEALGIDPEAFLRAATTGRFELPPYLPAGTPGVEGFLFPATYEFAPDVTADTVIQRMLDQFERVAADLPWDRAEALGVPPFEIVVIASLIEREARFDEDRARIAAVIHNRLEQGMRLQIDATVQYALGEWVPITLEDREVDSPYNTYRVDALPVGPIASPGEASLRAALNPADANFLYYVVIDAEGHHAFTADYQEFLDLVDQYQG